MIDLEIKEIKDIPKELYDVLVESFKKYEMPLDNISDIQEYIQECGDYKKEIDSDYVSHSYFHQVGDFLLECYGSQYIKDQSLCDEQMGDEIYISNLKEKKEAEKKEKDIKKNKTKIVSSEKWSIFLDDINSDLNLSTETSAKLKEILSEYRFPTKFK